MMHWKKTTWEALEDEGWPSLPERFMDDLEWRQADLEESGQAEAFVCEPFLLVAGYADKTTDGKGYNLLQRLEYDANSEVCFSDEKQLHWLGHGSWSLEFGKRRAHKLADMDLRDQWAEAYTCW